MPSSKNLCIGILGGGGADWVAGVIYTRNLQRSFELVADKTSLRSIMIERGYRKSVDCLSGPSASMVRFFSHIESAREPRWKQLGKRVVAFARHPGAASLENTIAREGVDLLFPAWTSLDRVTCSTVSWIPDFQHVRKPEFFPGAAGEERTHVVDRILDEAQYIVLSSESARKDALAYRPQYAGKFRVMPFVLLPDESWFVDDPTASAASFSGGREYLIFPSQLWAHKGHKTLIEAVAILRRRFKSDILVLCPGFQRDHRFPGFFGEICDLAGKLGVSDNVRFPGLLPRIVLVQLIRAAKAVVQPSQFEGWSALLEDAQGLGKPVFASDLPVHREQNPPDTMYFPEGDAEALAALVEENWNAMPSGFDVKRERVARERQLARGSEFGLRFARMATEIVAERRRSQ